MAKIFLGYHYIPGIPILVTGFDISIFTIITSSVIGLAFWAAAMVLPSYDFPYRFDLKSYLSKTT